MTTAAQAPSNRTAVDDQNPWPGLVSFDENSERFFNGRKSESAELRRLVQTAPLTVLFGASGLGKTSLLQAGLFPQLRKQHYLPVYVRLDLRDRAAPLIDQAGLALQRQIAIRHIDAPPMRLDEPLWSYLHRAGLEFWSEQNQLLTPVFVFDQFEEVFTLGAENPQSIARLRIDLADLIENRLPSMLTDELREQENDTQRYRVVLSFREDFLPAVEGWKRDLPSIMRNRLRLLPMSGEQAFEAVHSTASQLVDESVARQIVRFVAAAQGDSGPGGSDGLDSFAVEPALLSLVCHGLNEKRKAENKLSFDEELLRGTGQSIISDYYQGAVDDLREQVRRFIENELITERGFRKPCDVDDAHGVHGITEHELRLLVDRRVLRIEPQRGAERIELTHDLLTKVVREHRDRQRERARVRRQRRRMGIFGAVVLVLAGLASLFAWLYVDARRLKTLAEQQTELAHEQVKKTEEQKGLTASALTEAEDKGKLARAAAHTAEVARRDADLQTRIATARRLASEASRRFESSADGLAISGALAVESLKSHPTPEGTAALAQVLRLIPPPPEIIPAAKTESTQGTHQARSLAFSRDGRWMATSGDGVVVLWSVADPTKKVILKTPIQSAPASSGLAFSYDGHLLAGGGFGAFSIWQTETGEQVQEPIRVGGFVRSAAFSPDGLRLAVAVRGVGAKLFQNTAGHWQEVEQVKPSVAFQDVNAVGFLSNARLALAGSYGQPLQHGVWFWDLATNKEAFLETGSVSEYYGLCRGLSISQDSRVMAALCAGGILVAQQSTTGFQVADSSRGGFGGFSVSYGISVSNSGDSVAAVDNAGTVHVYGNPVQQEISILAASSDSVAFRPDGKSLATGRRDGSIGIWATTRGTESIRVPCEGMVAALAFSPGDRYLAMAGEDGTLRVFEIFKDAPIRPVRTLPMASNPSSVTFSADGRFLAVLDSGGLHVILTNQWKRLLQSDVPGKFDTVGFSTNGRVAILIEKGKIHRFDTDTWREKKPVIKTSQDSFEWRLSADGRWLALEYEIRRSRRGPLTYSRELWDLATGAATASKEAPGPELNGDLQGGSQGSSSDSEGSRARQNKSLSRDGAWNFDLNRYSSTLVLRSGSLDVANLEHGGDVTDAAFSPAGRWLATSSRDGTVRLWPLQPEDLVKRACAMLPRNLTPQEWNEFHMQGLYRKACLNLP